MLKLCQVAKMAHFYLDQVIGEGDCVVDATAGNGYDTLYLAEKVGRSGQVYSFDIQEKALAATAARLKENDMTDQVTLIKDGHEFMNSYLQEPAAAIIYNLGYLPGGDHSIATRLNTTLASFKQALGLIKPGGLLTVTMYPGHDQGVIERDGLLAACEGLPSAEYSAACFKLINRSNRPPELLIVQKEGNKKGIRL
jgi:tRNA G37 N-methylase Trm5